MVLKHHGGWSGGGSGQKWHSYIHTETRSGIGCDEASIDQWQVYSHCLYHEFIIFHPSISIIHPPKFSHLRPIFPYPQPNPPYPITKTTTLCKFLETKKNMPHLFISHLGHLEKGPTTLLPMNLASPMGYINPHFLGQWHPPSRVPHPGFCYIPGGFLPISSTITPVSTPPITHITQPSNPHQSSSESKGSSSKSYPTQSPISPNHLTIYPSHPSNLRRLRAALGLSSGPADYKLMAGRQGCTLVKVTWTAVEQAGQRGSGSPRWLAGCLWMWNGKIWVFPKIGVRPKWMVYNGKPF